MNPAEFARWLQGFAELTDGTPSEAQWKSIKEHLQLCFVKVTPATGTTTTWTPSLLQDGGTRIC